MAMRRASILMQDFQEALYLKIVQDCTYWDQSNHKCSKLKASLPGGQKDIATKQKPTKANNAASCGRRCLDVRTKGNL